MQGFIFRRQANGEQTVELNGCVEMPKSVCVCVKERESVRVCLGGGGLCKAS